MILQKATPADLLQAAFNLHPSDLCEFHCSVAGRDPAMILPTYHDETTMAIKVGSLVLAVGGSKDCLWFVTTNVVIDLPKAQRLEFFRMLKGHLNGLREGGHQSLTNYVSVDNLPHIRLLNALGARWSEEISMSKAGFAFRQFWL